jgi:integrase
MARKPLRTEWHQQKGKWTRSLGERGVRIRLFQRAKDGVFHRAIWIPGRGIDRVSLGTTDRDEAEQLGRALLVALLREEEIAQSGVLTLEDLWHRFSGESVAYRGYTKAQQDDCESRVDVLIAFFGGDCDVKQLTADDLLAFEEKRLAGKIVCSEKRTTKAVLPRSVQADIEILSRMLQWAVTCRTPKGKRLLDASPLAGIKRPSRGNNQKRPVASWERFEATRKAARELAANAKGDSARRKWIRLDMAIVLAEATGRRIGSIRQLEWSDVDLERSRIRWRAEADKKRKEWSVPILSALRDELRSFRVKLGGAFGGLLFPSPVDSTVAAQTDVLSGLLLEAEAHAKLPKLDGSLWHAYRRKWATERKHLPLKDVADAGGWSEVSTLLRCYTQSDDKTMLAVMSEPRKVTEKVQNG